MARTLDEIYKMLGETAKTIVQLEQQSTYDKYEDCSGLFINPDNPDDMQKWHTLENIMDKLNDVRKTIQYLNAPVDYEDKLHLNGSGRYEDSHGMEYTSGTAIEFLHPGDEEADIPSEWIWSRVEHNGTDYYIVGQSYDLRMDGLRTRIRKRS